MLNIKDAVKVDATNKEVFDILNNFDNVKNVVKCFIRNEEAFYENDYKRPYIADMWFGYYINVDELGEEFGNEIKKITGSNEDCATVKVNKTMVEDWGIFSDYFHDIALNNTLKANNVEYLDLSNYLDLFSGHPEKKNVKELERTPGQHIIVKNDTNNRGAVVMLDKKKLNELAEFFNGDFYILPSSIHEIIVMEANGNDANELAEMVKQINKQTVDLKDKLSDHVYRYNAKTHMIEFSA